MDPGFPVGGTDPLGGAPTSEEGTFRPKHAKMKELGPVGEGGGRALAAPPGSATVFQVKH